MLNTSVLPNEVMSKRRAGRVVAEYNPLEEWTVTMLRLLLSYCAEAGLFNPATSRAKHTVLNIHLGRRCFGV